jgi:hypothetical protein
MKATRTSEVLLIAVLMVLARVGMAGAPLTVIISRDDPAGSKGHVRFRFVNAIPDSPPLDLRIGLESAIANVPYGSASSFVDFANGPLVPSHITVVPSGGTGPVLAEIGTPCSNDCDNTLVATGPMNSPSLLFLWGTADTPPGGQAWVRLFQASPNTLAMRVRFAGGLTLGSYLEFGESTEYASVAAGTTEVEFLDESKDGAVALTMPVVLADGGVYTIYLTGMQANAPLSASFIPVAIRESGLHGTQWRSDLGLLNIGSATATVQLQFFGSDGVASNTVQVPAGAQSILTDVVGQLGAEGQGALEITADQPLKITSRTYNQAPADAGCFPNGTQGQAFPVLTAGGGLATGESAYLPGLVQNADYRSNIGLVNTDDSPATVLVELFDGAGGKLAEYTVVLAHGQWAQENRPFEKKAGQTTLDRGYAKVTVQSGSGVYAFASVIDNVTNDPTTVAMQR